MEDIRREAFFAQIPAGHEVFFPGDEVISVLDKHCDTIRALLIAENCRDMPWLVPYAPS
jgi:hypothetical protein